MAFLEDVLTPMLGIYTITARSEFNGFAQWYTINVERSPSSEFAAPEGYIMTSSNEVISTAGVALIETYVPKMILDIQKLILVLPSQDAKPDSGPTSKVPVFSYVDAADIADHALNIPYVLNALLTKVGSEAGVTMSSSLQQTYILFGQYFVVPPYTITYMLQVSRLTPMSAMGTIYQGLGLVLKQQTGGEFVLTDLTTLMGGPATSVSSGNIVSVTSGYDFTRIPKTQSIHFDAGGDITDTDLTKRQDAEAIGNADLESHSNYANNHLLTRGTAGAAVSVAVGSDAHMVQEPVPLLMTAGLKDIIPDGDGKATISLGDVEKVVQLERIKKVNDQLFAKVDMNATEEEWNYAAAKVVLVALFMEKLQAIMSLKILMASSSKTAVVDDTLVEAYGNIEFSDGEVSLQKAVISNTGVEQVTEEGNLADHGFVIGVTLVLQAGLQTSTVSYVNLSEAYEGIF